MAVPHKRNAKLLPFANHLKAHRCYLVSYFNTGPGILPTLTQPGRQRIDTSLRSQQERRHMYLEFICKLISCSSLLSAPHNDTERSNAAISRRPCCWSSTRKPAAMTMALKLHRQTMDLSSRHPVVYLHKCNTAV